MMPKEVFQKVGGFDEDYFMYGEDLDLCYRIKEAGYRVVYFAGASMTHLRGQSGLSAQSKEIIYQFHYAMALFYRKHFKKKYNVFVTGAVYAEHLAEIWPYPSEINAEKRMIWGL